MKLYAPKYYKEFHCIADKCEHSCCIGWEIDIDEEALKKYRRRKGGYGAVVRNSVSTSGTPHFKLGAGDRCPHLDAHGLCKIILTLGEDYLCDICREPPRFYNYTGAVEVGLGMSCGEAARIILSSPDYAEMEELGEVAIEADGVDFDGRAARGEIYAILADSAHDYSKALSKIYAAYDIDAGEDGAWPELLDGLEYLNAEHKPLFMRYSCENRPEGAEAATYLERFFAYLVYRHCTEAIDAEDFAVRLAFCLFCERLLASLMVTEKAGSLHEVAALASIISEEIEYSDDNTAVLMGE